MAGIALAIRNQMLDDKFSGTLYLSLHTADPGDNGANEVATGVYGRQSVTFGNAASNGTKTASVCNASFTVPAGTTVAFVGCWTAATSGTYLGKVDVTDEAYTGQGTYQVTSASFSIT